MKIDEQIIDAGLLFPQKMSPFKEKKEKEETDNELILISTIYTHFFFVTYNKIRTVNMGTSMGIGITFMKDEKITMYVEVDKPYYIAGEKVQGFVYINAKETRKYKNLALGFTGK